MKKLTIYGIALCFIIFSFSCKKGNNTAAYNTGANIIPFPIVPPIANNTYLVNAQFEKPYYLNTTTPKPIPTTVLVDFQYTQNSDIVNNIPIFYALYSDPTFSNLIQSDDLIIEKGKISFNVDLQKYPEGYLIFYLQITFSNTTFTSDLPVYKLSKFPDLSIFQTPDVTVTFSTLIYSFPNFLVKANFAGFSIPAGNYPLEYQIMTSSGQIFNSIPLTIAIQADGTAYQEFSVSNIPRGDFTVLFAISEQDDYIWINSPVLTMIK